ncbi:hypothetical protein [Bradyrhizobium sp.]|uniref:hypothetical protein n=1 Tax=Bradyrhizobium sp. TaxID=376 RepID=UPI0025C07636|nr:hypothetical protein [Bradyrhizobium sp.]
MRDPSYGAYWRTWSCGFVAADGTQAKILVDETPATVLPAVAGETAFPGEVTVRQRILQGGCRVIDGSLASSDGTARSLVLWLGRVLSRAADFGGTLTVTTQNVFNRAAGSFLTDGWRVGDSVMPFGMTTAANNGVAGLVTAVTALALTVNGTPYTNETMPATARLIRVSQRTRRAVPINAGNLDTTPAVALMGGAQDPAAPALPDTGYSLGDVDVLIAAMAAAVSALPARVDAQAVTARY